MPSPLSHSLMGYLFLNSAQKNRLVTQFDWKAPAAYVLFANFPDLDFIPGIIAGNPSQFHHGKWIAHSFGAGTILAGALWLILKVLKQQNAGLWAFSFLALYSSHILLDFFCRDMSPPVGQMIFWPVSREHFISPVSIFSDMKRNSFAGIFSFYNLKAIFREAAVFAPFLLLTYWQTFQIRKKNGFK